MTSTPEGAASVALAAGPWQLLVEQEGARIASLRWSDPRRGRAGAGVELLATTPWADDPDGAFRMRESAQEWHRRYRGGWHVLIPRSGDPVTVDGVEQPFHGEAAWRLWTLRRERSSACVASVSLRTVPVELERRIDLEDDRIAITQSLGNHSSRPVSIGWLEHPAFDGRLFDGSSVRVGEGLRVPILPEGRSGFDDVAADSGEWTVLSPLLGATLEMRWDVRLLPRVHVWQERRGTPGFPWWGSVDAVGVEPASDPHGASVDRLGSVVVPPGTSVSGRVELIVRAAT